MKRLLISMLALGFAASLTAFAEQTADKTAANKPVIAKAVSAADIILTGKLMKKEDVKGEAKADVKKVGDTEVIKEKVKEAITSKFILVTADGDVVLPEPKAKAGEQVIVLDTFVGQDVKVVAKGMEKKVGDKKVIKVKSIVSVEPISVVAK